MARRPSSSKRQHNFAKGPQVSAPRSVFNRSCGTKTTFDAGYLVPVFVDEAMPGDTINLKTNMFVRFATLWEPILDNVFLDMFWFAIPIRLVYDKFINLMGEKADPDSSTDYIMPIMTSHSTNGHAEESLSDYFGIPTKIPGLSHRSDFHRAYHLVWNEWFRSQQIQDSVQVDKDEGPDDDTVYASLLKRGKRMDYFTACLPYPQAGDPVTLPLGTYAPVISDEGIDGGLGYPNFELAGSGGFQLQSASSGDNTQWDDARGNELTAQWDTTTGLVTDLSEATAATINQIRLAFQMQRMLERNARGGERYTETIRAHFGVSSPDQRLQRPEFLGGSTTTLVVNQVAATNAGTTVKIGDLGAFATAAHSDRGFIKSFTEHCLIIGMVCARADLTYQQGLPRMFSRSTRYDFPWPTLAVLGEQAVLNKELWAQGSDSPTDDAATFGYIPRYDERRYKPSMITGEFRSNHTVPLDKWHLAQDFDSLPTLSPAFIEEDPPMDRVIAVTGTAPQFLGDFFFEFTHAQCLPTRGTPGMIDHF